MITVNSHMSVPTLCPVHGWSVVAMTRVTIFAAEQSATVVLEVRTQNITAAVLLHYTTLHYTTLHYTTLYYTTQPYITLHYTTLHYTKLHYTKLHFKYKLYYTTPQNTTLHYTALHSNTLNYVSLTNYALISGGNENTRVRIEAGTACPRCIFGRAAFRGTDLLRVAHRPHCPQGCHPGTKTPGH